MEYLRRVKREVVIIIIKIVLCSMLALFSLHPSFVCAAQMKRDRHYYESKGEIIWEIPLNKKLIALTFDDGPDPIRTPEILALLKKYDAKATFFVLGRWADRYPQLIAKQQQEGHEVSNHTYAHATMGRNPSPYLEEMKKTDRCIVRAGANKPVLFRPPGGDYNETIVQASKQLGHKVILWSWHQDTKDWTYPGTHRIVDKVLNNAKSGDIVLFHDRVQKNRQTIEALAQILPVLQKRGYRFVTVSQLIKEKQREVVAKATKKGEAN